MRVFSSNELRLGLAIATVARWKMQPDVNVTVLKWGYGMEHDFAACRTLCFGNEPKPFATASLEAAEMLAESAPYIICNDDNLIYGRDFVSKGLDIMQRYPDYGVISGVVTNDPHQFDKADEVTEIHAVGGIVFLRKGLVTEFPPLEDCFWDGERHKQVVAKGFKSGYAKGLPYLHMGAHYSVANPAFCVGI